MGEGYIIVLIVCFLLCVCQGAKVIKNLDSKDKHGRKDASLMWKEMYFCPDNSKKK